MVRRIERAPHTFRLRNVSYKKALRREGLFLKLTFRPSWVLASFLETEFLSFN